MPGVVSRAKFAKMADNLNNQITLNRNSSYGEAAINPLHRLQQLADEGSYFFTTNPTIGTAIQLNANVTAFSDTNGLFVIGNTASANNNPPAPSIYLDYLRLNLAGTAPTGTVTMFFAFKKSLISREPTTAANRTLLTPVNMRGSTGISSVARVMSYANAGAMTVPASVASDAVVGRCSIPTGLGISGDEYMVKFASDDMMVWQGGAAVRATDVARRGTVCTPVTVDPGEWVVCHMWWVTAATTAASFEFDLGWIER